ncbi:MAG: methyltransferase [Austwickia sp.]|nr:methyltransferase [Austwickia sp.]MBK8437806.1 methyltransferase [Austwickia sp.]MBK9100113.1 methyltransferase [Austwickia sp.]
MADRLRADLVAAGYTVDGVLDRVGAAAHAALPHDGGAAVRHVLRETSDPCAVLIRAWTLGEPVAGTHLAGALPRTGLTGLTSLGLIAPAGAGRVRATCDVRPYAVQSGAGVLDTWLVSDFGESVIGGPLPPDHVLGVGGASLTLSSWTPRTAVGRALDLGTGCGVQAVALARHADQVVATDLDERALRYARLTAALAGQTWDLRQGDLFEPVTGERFDLIVANPPFVITPRTSEVPRYTYRDGGRAGDELMGTLIRACVDHLEPGGVAQFLGNWEIPVGADHWSHRPEAWLADTELDAWVIQRDVAEPAEYAHTWIRDGGHRPGMAGYQELTDAWLDDFARRAVAAVGFGVLTVSRPGAVGAAGSSGDRSPYRVFEEVLTPVAEPMGPAVAAGLAARRWLADHPEAAVLDRAWRCAPDVLEERYGVPGAADPAVIRLTQGGGLRRTVTLDTVGAAVIGVGDGSLTAGQALTAVCAILREDPCAHRAQVIDLLRTLIADALLIPADGVPTPGG